MENFRKAKDEDEGRGFSVPKQLQPKSKVQGFWITGLPYQDKVEQKYVKLYKNMKT